MPPMADADPEAYAKATGWPEIKKVQPEMPELPAFPTNLLPPVLGEMVEQTAGAIQAPVDIAGMLVLPVATSNLAGKVQFEGREEHLEQAVLWTLTAAATSERKTPVFNRLRKALDETAAAYSDLWQADDEVRQTQLDMVEANIKTLKDQLSKDAELNNTSTISDTAKDKLKELLRQRIELEKPLYKPCVWATSPTPEGLHSVMADNGGRVAVFSDEGGLIGTLAGRYSSKDGADIDPFLSGFVGGALKAPRAGGGRKDVPAAYVTIGLAVQPSVLDELGAMKGAADRGLLGRFLYAMSSTLVGTRMYGASKPIEPRVIQAYHRALAEWANWPGKDELVTIRLTPAAYRTYEKFHDSIEVRAGKGGDLHESLIVSKIAGTTLRVAGLFHCYEHGRNSAMGVDIGEDTMLRAIEMSNSYFIPHSMAVAARFVSAGISGIEGRILNKIKREGWREFKLRDLFQDLKGRGDNATVKRASDLDDAIAALIEDGYIREVDKDSGNGKNSRTHVFEVNPAVFQ